MPPFMAGGVTRLPAKFIFVKRDDFRSHQALDDMTPDEVCYDLPHPFAKAA